MERRFVAIARASLVALSFIAIGLPALALVVLSSSGQNLALSLDISKMSASSFFHALQLPGAGAAVLSGISTSIVVGVAATGLGTASAWRAVAGSPRRLSLLVSTLPLLVPNLVVALGSMLVLQLIGASPRPWSAIALQICYAGAVALLLMTSALTTFDRDLPAAARNLGASSWVVFSKILFPLLARPLAATMLVSALFSWDEFVLAFFAGGRLNTVPTWSFSQLAGAIQPGLFALAALSTTAVFFLSMAALRLFDRGR